jgi:demethoxyubiquinone hydroxylase (CLK1/Coq7/Cat5 family)
MSLRELDGSQTALDDTSSKANALFFLAIIRLARLGRLFALLFYNVQVTCMRETHAERHLRHVLCVFYRTPLS